MPRHSIFLSSIALILAIGGRTEAGIIPLYSDVTANPTGGFYASNTGPTSNPVSQSQGATLNPLAAQSSITDTTPGGSINVFGSGAESFTNAAQGTAVFTNVGYITSSNGNTPGANVGPLVYTEYTFSTSNLSSILFNYTDSSTNVGPFGPPGLSLALYIPYDGNPTSGEYLLAVQAVSYGTGTTQLLIGNGTPSPTQDYLLLIQVGGGFSGGVPNTGTATNATVNFTINTQSAVPEPTSILLLGLGISAMMVHTGYRSARNGTQGEIRSGKKRDYLLF